MTDDPTRRPHSERRASPFDEGFVTLWKNHDAPAADDVTPPDERTKTDSYLPDAWGDDGADGAAGGHRDPAPAEHTDAPVDIAIDALRSEEAQLERAAANEALRPVLRSLEAEGLYAYITLDDENRWTVASDDEQGRVDVRLDDGDYEVVMAATSPGMYADEDNAYRRRSLERLARMLIPRVARGYLADHQRASWDDVEAGVAVQVRYVLPRAEPEAIGPFVREHFEELEELLSFVEEQISR